VCSHVKAEGYHIHRSAAFSNGIHLSPATHLCVFFPVQRFVGKRVDVLGRLWAVVLARLRRQGMRARDDIEIVVAAQYHVFPLGERGQSHICDGSLERRLLCVLFAFRGGE